MASQRWMGLCAAGIAAGTLGAQSIWLPASDAVGIGRSGAGVAFGQSLEAASLNPALLATIRDKGSAFVSLGQELSASQIALGANSRVLETTDRNRFLPAFGSQWRLNDTWALGLKYDTPFLKHGILNPESTARFTASALDLKVRRVEAQLAWAPLPELAFGIGLGFAQMDYASEVYANAVVRNANNGVEGLMFTPIRQEGHKTAPSYSLGFRWAINPRWTFAGAHQGKLSGDLSPRASSGQGDISYVGKNGGAAPADIDGLGSILLANSRMHPGYGDLVLPAKTTLGLRHRLFQSFTWEADLQYIQVSQFQTPCQPFLLTPTGAYHAPWNTGTSRQGGFGFHLMGEIVLTKRWTARGGLSMDPALRPEQEVEPLIMGAQATGFSLGMSYKVWGGELSLGYQYRQGKDTDRANLEGHWSAAGFAPAGTTTRVEGMGHLWALSFKTAF